MNGLHFRWLIQTAGRPNKSAIDVVLGLELTVVVQWYVRCGKEFASVFEFLSD